MLLDDIEVLSNLGQGSHGHVFYCRDKSTENTFVMKRILRKFKSYGEKFDESNEDFIERVRREYHVQRFAWKLAEKHKMTKYLIKPLGLWIENLESNEADGAFIKYSFLNAMDLGRFWKSFVLKLQGSPHFERLGHKILSQVLRIVGFLNSYDIYHCDIKYNNILIHKKDNKEITMADLTDSSTVFCVKLIDFGLAATRVDSLLAHRYSHENGINHSLMSGTSLSRFAVYLTTEYARDPRITFDELTDSDHFVFGRHIARNNDNMALFTPFQTSVFFPWFELYAVAVMAHLLFDPNSDPETLVFRKTNLMSDEFYDIVCEMSGDLCKRKSARHYAERFESLH